jgi:branched-chain amino acid transport system substrate-binding protein
MKYSHIKRSLAGCLKLSLSALFILFLSSGCDNNEIIKAPCEDSIGCVDIAPDAPLKIGVLQALSGDVATLGEEQIRGLELALARIDNQILGHTVQLQIEDTGCSAEGGANSVLKLIADPDTIAIYGTTCSGAAASASYAMSRAGLTMISGNNSAPFLTSIAGKRAPDFHPGYFRTATNEEKAGKAAAIYARTHLKLETAALINDGDIYSKGLTEGFRVTFEALGGTIVLNSSVSKGDQDMTPILDGVAQSKAQMIFFPLFQPEGNYLLLQARKHPYCKNTILMSDGALINSSFIEQVGDAGIGMYFVGPAAPEDSAATTALTQEYLEKYKSEPTVFYYMSGFDAANILFEALANSATVHPDDSLSIGRQALRDAILATRDVQGVTGPMGCDAFGDCAQPHFNILQLKTPGDGVEGLQKNVLFRLSPSQKKS